MDDALNVIFLKSYSPEKGRFRSHWAPFENGESTTGMLRWLRSRASLIKEGPSSDILVWKDVSDGPQRPAL